MGIFDKKKLEEIEKSPEWKAILYSSLTNIFLVLICFGLVYLATANIIASMYFALIILAFTDFVTVIGWIGYTFKHIKDKSVAAAVYFAMIVTLAVMIIILYQVISVLGTFL